MRACSKCGGSDLVGRDGMCRRCRCTALGHARTQYRFTAELDAELRLVYAARKSQVTAGLDRLQRRTGWPRTVFYRRAAALEILHGKTRRPWRAWEVEYIQEKLGAVSVGQVARVLKRSVWSVKLKAARLGVSCRLEDGYDVQDIAEVFGVGDAKVRRWMARGLFGAVHARGGFRVKESNVLRFVRRHASEYDLRLIDQMWLKAMLFARGEA